MRAIPKSIEEIIASLQSEAQLASDQTIKELIQSVLGQNYDIKMEVGDPEQGSYFFWINFISGFRHKIVHIVCSKLDKLEKLDKVLGC